MTTIPNWLLRILLWLFLFLPLLSIFFFAINFIGVSDTPIAYILLAIWIAWFLYSIYKIIISLFKKPSEEEFITLLQDTSKKSKDASISRNRLTLSLLNEIKYIEYDEIIRCEASNTYTIFYFTNKESVIATKTLKEYADLLKPNGFIRTHQSHLINPKFVKSWLKEDGGILLLNNGDKIPISKPNKEIVKLALQQL